MRWKSRKIREVSPLAQLGIKREHSESLLQDLVNLFPEKHQLMIGSYIVYFHQQRCKLLHTHDTDAMLDLRAEPRGLM